MGNSIRDLQKKTAGDEARANTTWKGFFPLQERTLSTIFQSLEKQVEHTRSVIGLAPDQADTERKALAKNLEVIYSIDRRRLSQDLTRDIAQRKDELADTEKVMRAGVIPIRTPDNLRAIIEGCTELKELIEHALRYITTLEENIRQKKDSELMKTWANFLGICTAERDLTERLWNLFSNPRMK